MAAYSTTRLFNGHLLTVTGTYRSGAGFFYRVEERNELGTFLHVAFTSRELDDAEAWVDRAARRGYGLRPTVPANEPVVHDPDAWRRVAVEGRRFA